MVENISYLIPYLVLSSHIILVILFLALISRKSLGKEIAGWLGKHAVVLALVAALAAVAGSLFYSEIMNFEPCVLCWWQRVFLYPLVIIFGISIWKKTKSAFLYAVPMALLVAFIAAYHSYANLGGASILPCTVFGGACSKVFVLSFGYITIPSMSLTISLYILLFAWADKIYGQNNSHS